MYSNFFLLKWIAGSVITVIFSYSLYYNSQILSRSNVPFSLILFIIIIILQVCTIYISFVLGKRVGKHYLNHKTSQPNDVIFFSMWVVIFRHLYHCNVFNFNHNNLLFIINLLFIKVFYIIKSIPESQYKNKCIVNFDYD